MVQNQQKWHFNCLDCITQAQTSWAAAALCRLTDGCFLLSDSSGALTKDPLLIKDGKQTELDHFCSFKSESVSLNSLLISGWKKLQLKAQRCHLLSRWWRCIEICTQNKFGFLPASSTNCLTRKHTTTKWCPCTTHVLRKCSGVSKLIMSWGIFILIEVTNKSAANIWSMLGWKK